MTLFLGGKNDTGEKKQSFLNGMDGSVETKQTKQNRIFMTHIDSKKITGILAYGSSVCLCMQHALMYALPVVCHYLVSSECTT